MIRVLDVSSDGIPHRVDLCLCRHAKDGRLNFMSRSGADTQDHIRAKRWLSTVHHPAQDKALPAEAGLARAVLGLLLEYVLPG